MSQLSWMITITDRKKAPDFVALYQQQNIHVSLTTVGAGTAVSETLNYLGLERTEKAVIFTTVTDSRWKAVKRQLEHTMNIDVPGTGIAFTILVSSIGGKRALQFLTEDQDFQIGEETTLKDTKYELLIVIANQGYIGLIMDAARQRKRGRRNRHPRQGYRDGTCRAVFGRFSRCRKGDGADRDQARR